MNLEGTWHTELGSTLVIDRVRDGGLSGTYKTALSASGSAKGSFEVAGRTDAARETYEAVLRHYPRLVGARINLGRLMHAAGNPSAAEAHYRAALELKPGNALAAFNLGVALEDQGKAAAAADAYRLALAADEAYADAHYNLSRLLEAQGDLRSALRHLSRFRRLMQNDKG